MTVVLAYDGEPSQRQDAEARLRRALPGVTLTCKTSTLLEVPLEPSELEEVLREGGWHIVQTVYADIRRPALNLERVRAKLGRR